MASTLSNGYILPASGDRGSTFFPALESNITRLNSHNHDGNNSELLTPSSITLTTQTLLAAGWTLVSPSVYRQLVTMPGTLTFDGRLIQCQIASGANSGDLFYPSIEKQSANTFYVYINDNTVDVLVKYA